MVNSILYSEINCVCILILILLCVKVKKSMFIQIQRQILHIIMVFNIAFYLLDAIWVFIDNNVFGINITINWSLNVTYYILSGCIGYLWFLFSEIIQESKYAMEKKYRIISAIPVIVLCILTLASIKTRWLFYIDKDNNYFRGPLYCIQLLLSYGYVIFTAAKAFILSFSTKDYGKKTELRILFSYVIPTLIAGVLQIIFPGFPILCVGNTVGIIYIYITLQEKLISVDVLTKLNNRNQIMQYLSTKFLHLNENKELYLLLMDVDYFKTINDKYGHIEGDKALQKLANCLLKVGCNRRYFTARYGGDEFIMICELEKAENIQRVCDSIHEQLHNTQTPYTLSVSIGCAKYTPDIKTYQELIAKADIELYKIKRKRN